MFEYDARKRVISQKDQNGNKTGYDYAGNRTSKTINESNTIYYVTGFVKICFNPEQNDKIVIIKRGKYNFGTLIWLYEIVWGIICLVTAIVGCVSGIRYRYEGSVHS